MGRYGTLAGSGTLLELLLWVLGAEERRRPFFVII